MLLKITEDRTSAGNVLVSLEDGKDSFAFSVNRFKSPFTRNFRRLLPWYFTDYVLDPQAVTDRDVAEKTLKFGHYLGDELLGEDHQLLRLVKQIENGGFARLQVEIEAHSPAFFDEYWESLVLPETPYILSAAVKGFTRRFARAAADLPPILLGLDAPAEAFGSVPGLASALTTTETQPEQMPLRILYLKVPSVAPAPFGESEILNLQVHLAEQGAADVELCLATMDEIAVRLRRKEEPIHMVCYMGPMILDDPAEPMLGNPETGTECIKLRELAQALVEHQVPVCFMQVTHAYGNATNLTSQAAFAHAAHLLLAVGVANVLGFSEIADPWTCNDIFRALIRQLLHGHSLGQAVIEVRKDCQRQLHLSRFGIEPKPFQSWMLLVHYGHRDVVFFKQSGAPAESAAKPLLALRKLLGFRREYLPPAAEYVGDGTCLAVAMDLLRCLRQQQGCVYILCAHAGFGKTTALHRISTALALSHAIDYAFYYDFGENFYAADDVLRMITPMLGLSETTDAAAIIDALHDKTCIFAFDNLFAGAGVSHERAAELDQLRNLMRLLQAAGQIVLMTCAPQQMVHMPDAVDIPGLEYVRIDGLTAIEQRLMTASLVKRPTVAHETRILFQRFWQEDLNRCFANPWLIEKVFHFNLHNHYQKRDAMPKFDRTDDLVRQWYDWQWSMMPNDAKNWLSWCARELDLLFEMLMIVVDNPKPIAAVDCLRGSASSPALPFQALLGQWLSAGFLHPLPIGHVLGAHAQKFLRRVDAEPDDAQHLAFSQIICEGVGLLCQALEKQPNPALSQHLLVNRGSWARHLEILWKQGEFIFFFRTKAALDSLLHGAGLAQESSAWSLQLLENSRDYLGVAHADDRAAAWLMLALSALPSVRGAPNDAIAEGMNYWSRWIEETSPEGAAAVTLNQLHLALSFLERAYALSKMWQKCILVVARARQMCELRGTWFKVFQHRKNEALYRYSDSDVAGAYSCEEALRNHPDFARLPEQARLQMLIDIVLMRVTHQQVHAAEELFMELQCTPGIDKFQDVMDGLQSELHFLKEDYREALPFYCRSWVQSVRAQQNPSLLLLQQRMLAIQQKLGRQCFEELFFAEVPEGTILPGALPSAVN